MTTSSQPDARATASSNRRKLSDISRRAFIASNTSRQHRRTHDHHDLLDARFTRIGDPMAASLGKRHDDSPQPA
jgi:hypothetical protein